MCRKNYLFCYDIADPKRLSRVRKLLFALSFGGQKSALNLLLSKEEVKQLLQQVSKFVDENEDKINLIAVEKKSFILTKKIDLVFENGAIIV